MKWELLLIGAGLALILEGFPYFLTPSGVKYMTSRISQFPHRALQIIGLLSMLMGLLFIYLARRSGI